ncbi:MAG TPA: hypothetical protein VKF38_09645 [Anaerolineaceae bacterium]|nr:hypothetical protein [Anaerolineaceae bacterium]
MKNNNRRIWIARLLIGWVFATNIQCAILFILFPGRYLFGFELTGIGGNGAIQGFGILFLMWNVPYSVALIQPNKNRLSLLEAVVMQAIGFVGETLLLIFLPQGHLFMAGTVIRFIVFDGSGLVLLLLSAWISRGEVKLNNSILT